MSTLVLFVVHQLSKLHYVNIFYNMIQLSVDLLLMKLYKETILIVNFRNLTALNVRKTLKTGENLRQNVAVIPEMCRNAEKTTCGL